MVSFALFFCEKTKEPGDVAFLHFFQQKRTTSMTSTAHSFLRKGLPLLTQVADNPHAAVGKWILATGGLVVGMIHVGGVTRLTQSGLSMTTWSPLGSLPPITREEWDNEFSRYKKFPEWQQRQSMSLDQFQYIYAWEYGHRMLGRFVGLAFCLPWAYFTVRGRIPQGYQGRMAMLASMGATQGLVGWWMVKSGLGQDRFGDKNEIHVKPARLATHLTLAVATYGVLTWTGLSILSLPHGPILKQLPDMAAKFPEAFRRASQLRLGTIAVTGLTALTIVSGALVAGNDAGRAYNTFPKMDGQWIPPEYIELTPWHRNVLENTATVQWNHRVLGTTTALTAISVVALGLLSPNKAALVTPQVRNGLVALGVAAVGQFTLGVTTLLYYVPISLAAVHQVGSVVVLTSGVYLLHSLRYARPALLRIGIVSPATKPAATLATRLEHSPR
jgi:heme a synthase